MTREEFINWFEERFAVTKNDIYELGQLYDEVTKPRWISVEDKLPKFNNEGRMIFNCFDWVRDNKTPKIHPTQKPVPLLEQLITIFTDKDDVVIDPCAGSGSTLLACANTGRRGYGFEIKKNFYKAAKAKVLANYQPKLFV